MAEYLSGRLHYQESQMPTRKSDMSPEAGLAFKAVLHEVGAGHMHSWGVHAGSRLASTIRSAVEKQSLKPQKSSGSGCCALM